MERILPSEKLRKELAEMMNNVQESWFSVLASAKDLEPICHTQ